MGITGTGGVQTGGGGTIDVVLTTPGVVGDDDCRRRVTPSSSSFGLEGNLGRSGSPFSSSMLVMILMCMGYIKRLSSCITIFVFLNMSKKKFVSEAVFLINFGSLKLVETSSPI